MTCTHCIGAEDIFNEKEARKNLKRYNRKGPNKTTKQLLTALGQDDITGLSLLDIGGGIGAIQVELLKRGFVADYGCRCFAGLHYSRTAIGETGKARAENQSHLCGFC